ncbi:hypothetical protein PLESTF_000377700 [Pleodorina starrii]|nr:hypothetical protein PLESTF_000377700 [Pleodorina starrii]
MAPPQPVIIGRRRVAAAPSPPVVSEDYAVDNAPTIACYFNITMNECVAQAHNFVQGGTTKDCRSYDTGTGDCTAAVFQAYVDSEIGSLCSMLASGVAVPI